LNRIISGMEASGSRPSRSSKRKSYADDEEEDNDDAPTISSTARQKKTRTEDDEDEDAMNPPRTRQNPRARSDMTSSSSSSSRSTRNANLANRTNTTSEADDEDGDRPSRLFRYDYHDSTTDDNLWRFAEPSEREHVAWNKLARDAQNQCVKKIVRLFIMRASKQESVNRPRVSDVLKEVDPNYRKHINVVLHIVQIILYDTFGYILTEAENLIGNSESSGSSTLEYYLSNGLRSPVLATKTSETSEDGSGAAFRGFVFVVCQVVASAAGRKVDVRSLLRALRLVDPRFPESLPRKSTSSSSRAASGGGVTGVAIPELRDDFLGLIATMRKQGYLALVKDDSDRDAEDPLNVVYTLGPRFFNDLGCKQMVKSHFLVQRLPIPEALMNSILDEEKKFVDNLKALMAEDEEEEAEEEPAPAPVSVPPPAAATSTSTRRTRGTK